jgi:hypothetical protein
MDEIIKFEGFAYGKRKKWKMLNFKSTHSGLFYKKIKMVLYENKFLSLSM